MIAETIKAILDETHRNRIAAREKLREGRCVSSGETLRDDEIVFSHVFIDRKVCVPVFFFFFFLLENSGTNAEMDTLIFLSRGIMRCMVSSIIELTRSLKLQFRGYTLLSG